MVSCPDDDGPELKDGSYGLTGPIIYFQKLVAQLATIDSATARAEVAHWPADDEYVFASSLSDLADYTRRGVFWRN